MSEPRHDIALGPSAEDLSRCVHCGFCLQACPTYLITGLETESPRGRIQLARALVEDRLEAPAAVAAHFDLCLQCRACEPACPSGVSYGRIMEGARALVQSRGDRPRAWRLRSLLLRTFFSHPKRLRRAFDLLRLYQRSPLAPLLRRLLPGRLRRLESGLPRIPGRAYEASPVTEPTVEPRATVAMLTGCAMPVTHPEASVATARVLAANGCRVLAPAAQGCCGALHLHNGDVEEARRLARRNIDVFLDSGAEAVVVNSAGCGSTMKEYGDLLAADAAYAEKAARFASLVRDVSEFLVQLPFRPPTGRVEARVTYQDPCHLLNAQRIRAAPRQILSSIPGLELVELEGADRCCGSAGIYSFSQPEMSRRLLDEKMDHVLATGCDVVSSANPGCLMQLQLGVREHDGRQSVVHVVELLDRAYRSPWRA